MPPKKYIKNIEAYKEAVEQYRKIHEWTLNFNSPEYSKFFKELGDLKFDTRDLPFFTVLLHGYSTKEQLLKDCLEEGNKIKEDFYGSMDRFLEAFDNKVKKGFNTDTVENCKDTLLMYKLAQLPGNIMNWRKDYQEYKLKDNKQIAEYDDIQAYMSNFSDTLSLFSEIENGYSLNTDTEVEHSPMPNEIALVQAPDLTDNYKMYDDFISGRTDGYEATAPDYFYYFEKIHNPNNSNLTQEEKEKYGGLLDSNDDIFSKIDAAFLNADSRAYRNLSEMDGRDYKSFFINGVSVFDAVPPLEGEAPDKTTERRNDFVAKSIIEGKSIDVARTRIEDGKAKTQIVPIKFKFNEDIVKKLQEEKVVKEHSWFRRTFFDWGPFKIKRDPNIVETLAKENGLAKEERFNKIMEYRNGKFLDELNAAREGKNLPKLEAGERVPTNYELANEKKQPVKRAIEIDLNKEANKEKEAEKEVSKVKSKVVAKDPRHQKQLEEYNAWKEQHPEYNSISSEERHKLYRQELANQKQALEQAPANPKRKEFDVPANDLVSDAEKQTDNSKVTKQEVVADKTVDK